MTRRRYLAELALLHATWLAVLAVIYIICR